MTVSGISGGVSDYGTERVEAAHRLEQATQAGKLTGEQADSAKVQKALQTQAAESQAIYSHGSLTGSSQPSAVFALYGALDHAVDSGNPVAAQQAYGALEREQQQFAQSGDVQPGPGSSNVSVSA